MSWVCAGCLIFRARKPCLGRWKRQRHAAETHQQARAGMPPANGPISGKMELEEMTTRGLPSKSPPLREPRHKPSNLMHTTWHTSRHAKSHKPRWQHKIRQEPAKTLNPKLPKLYDECLGDNSILPLACLHVHEASGGHLSAWVWGCGVRGIRV